MSIYVWTAVQRDSTFRSACPVDVTHIFICVLYIWCICIIHMIYVYYYTHHICVHVTHIFICVLYTWCTCIIHLIYVYTYIHHICVDVTHIFVCVLYTWCICIIHVIYVYTYIRHTHICIGAYVYTYNHVYIHVKSSLKRQHLQINALSGCDSRIHVCAYIRKCTHIFIIFVYTHICIGKYVYTYIHVYLHEQQLKVTAHLDSCARVKWLIYLYVCIYTYVYTYIHAHLTIHT